jgi:hypothetical protein
MSVAFRLLGSHFVALLAEHPQLFRLAKQPLGERRQVGETFQRAAGLDVVDVNFLGRVPMPAVGAQVLPAAGLTDCTTGARTSSLAAVVKPKT